MFITTATTIIIIIIMIMIMIITIHINIILIMGMHRGTHQVITRSVEMGEGGSGTRPDVPVSGYGVTHAGSHARTRACSLSHTHTDAHTERRKISTGRHMRARTRAHSNTHAHAYAHVDACARWVFTAVYLHAPPSWLGSTSMALRDRSTERIRCSSLISGVQGCGV